MRRWKSAVSALLSMMAFAFVFLMFQRLVMPKYASEIPEGNFTGEYYDETTGHDVLIIGDCEVYENIDPIYLFQNYGITSYIRGNAQQLTWQSYYMLEDALNYETPKVVIYNVQALSYARPQKEEYNRMVLDGMRWSPAKLDAIRVSMCEGEHVLDYLFPLFRYHQRFLSLRREDITWFWKRPKVSHNGYYMRIDVLPASESDVADTSWLFGDEAEESLEGSDTEEIIDPWGDLPDEMISDSEEQTGNNTEKNNFFKEHSEGETFGELPMKYLDKIRSLCRENDIALILMKAPSLAPQWYDTDNAQVQEYANKYGLPYINCYEHLDEMGIDFEKDTYDGGLHLNLSGAHKLSEYLGKVLREDFSVSDHRGEQEISKVYSEKIAFYDEMIKKQKEELEKYGEIRSY